MDKTALSTKYEFEFCDGTTCKMTLAFYLLKKLASVKPALYKRYQPIMTNGPKDEFDMLTLLYTAYVCANMDSETLLSEDDFIEMCGTDRIAIRNAIEAMTNPKKQKASEVHSS